MTTADSLLRTVARVVVVALAGGCVDQPPPSGTSVGNPGKTWARLAPIDGATLADIAVDALAVDLVGCDGVAGGVLAEVDLDLTREDPFAVPGGSWCAAVVQIGGISAVGAGPEGAALELAFDVDLTLTLWAPAPIVVDEDAFVLELGGPGDLSLTGIEPGDGGAISVGPESPFAARFGLGVARGTAWYPDDGDGVISDDERGAGALAATAFAPPPDLAQADTGAGASGDAVSLEGCNCATGAPTGAVASAWAALALGFTASRRTGGRRRSAGR
ncbi:MAG: hypothetical protein ABMB14_02310 [Myxococcota bacterium]